MKYWQRCRLILAFIGITTALKAQTADLSPAAWQAHWISAADAEPSAYGIYLFRKQIELTNYSGPFIIHLSADQQYRLYVNGKFTGIGPARFDLANWYYETIDIGPYLKFGTNVIAVEVINYGQYKPLARFTQGTGLIIQGHTDKEAALINTGTTTWKAAANDGINVWPVKTGSFYGAYPGDSITAQYQPWGWEQAGFNDAGWKVAEVGTVAELQGNNSRYWRLLTPGISNPLTLDRQRFIKVEGINKSFLSGTEPAIIAAKQKVSLMFDAGRQTIGFPELLISGGLDADISITYIPEYKDAPEVHDHIKPDGASRRTFSPTGYRSFRYVKVEISTGKTALTLLDYSNLYTQQLLVDKSSFHAEAEQDTLWGTARALTFAGAQDFLVDNIYSGHLQLIGSAAIHGQAIAALTGDVRLLKQAIWQANESRIPEGLIRSAYPSDNRVISVTGSLQWIDAIQSYLMLKDDKELAKELYPGIVAILNWFKRYQDVNTGLATEKMLYRNAPLVRLTYQYLYALRQAAQIAGYCSLPADSLGFSKTADKLRETLYQRCYNSESGVIIEKEGGAAFTRYTNALAALAQAIPPKQVKNVLQRAFTDKGMSQHERLWEKYIVFKAMQENGYTELFGEELKSVAGMYERKEPEFFTSSAGVVNLYLLGITAGIQSASYGYRTVLIAPDPGTLPAVKATMVHPDGGTMSVDLQFAGNRVKGKVNLPFGITGKFRWRGKEITLHGGPQDVNL